MHQSTKQKHAALPFISRAFLGVVLLTATFDFLTPAAFAASKMTPPPLIETVCKDTSIQPGWVIVDILTDWRRCKGGLLNPGNVWAITKATGPTHVCSNSPIPQGFVVTAQDLDVQNCRLVGLSWASRTITPVAGLSTITICASSPIPAGWVVTGEARLRDRPQAATTCPADAATATAFASTGKDLNALVQKTLRPVTNRSMQVCADSPLPKGYSVKQRTIYLTACPLDQGTSLLIVPFWYLL
jgi:hypothetical protein